ncbi:hypothetical protein [Paucilactobacillus vaccinostercus]|nr:hypothetical protein [Paucilactobacillus vaccinostercus]
MNATTLTCMYGDTTLQQKQLFDRFNVEPAYIRYFATGRLELHISDYDNIQESGPMIYEFPYIGKKNLHANL